MQVPCMVRLFIVFMGHKRRIEGGILFRRRVHVKVNAEFHCRMFEVVVELSSRSFLYFITINNMVFDCCMLATWLCGSLLFLRWYHMMVCLGGALGRILVDNFS